jgi:hypothetical protein
LLAVGWKKGVKTKIMTKHEVMKALAMSKPKKIYESWCA